MIKSTKSRIFPPHIFPFLNPKDLSVLSTVSKLLHSQIQSQKLIKKSLYLSELPGQFRINFWKHFSKFFDHKKRVLSTHQSYSHILEKANTLTSVKDRIFKDLHRTHLVSSDPSRQESLCRVLLCVAYLIPEVSYCQGMNCVAAVLLLVLKEEEDCMFMFVSIIEEWNLVKLYESGLPDLLLREYQFNVFFKRLMPELFSHFKKEDVTTGFFMSRWYLTIFSIYLPLKHCVRIWDCVFLSNWKAIIKISLSLMAELKPRLVGMDKARISSFLRDSVRENCDYSFVLKEALNIKVTNKALKKLSKEFYIQVADYKLKNLEPYLTEEESYALNETKVKLAEHSEENFRLILELQKIIEVQGRKIEELFREAQDMAREINDLEGLIENQCERKAVYVKTLEDLKACENREIFKEDIIVMQGKIMKIDEDLKEIKKNYIDKDAAFMIVKDSLNMGVKNKEKNSRRLLEYISQDKIEKEGMLLQLSKKLSPISLS